MSEKLPAIVIPAYQPDEQLVLLIRELRAQRPNQIIVVVNDGSSTSCQRIFAALADYEVNVLHHEMNLGKGQALKTAFNYYLKIFAESPVGVVTADADGQHSVTDIIALSDALTHAPQHLHLGVRSFAEEDIPWRSKFGNVLTGYIFRQMSSSPLYDTQTGLRGIPFGLMEIVSRSKSNGYEFELEMLLLAAERRIQLNQVPIKTIYIANNKASHFNPLIDSIKIYLVFLRFSAISLVSFLLDLAVFFLCYFLSHQILLATVLGKLVAGCFNFKFHHRFKRSVIAMMLAGLLSYGMIIIMNSLGMNIILSKLAAEIILVLINLAMNKLFKLRDASEDKITG